MAATEEAHFADGIDTPDRFVLGLSAGQLVVVVAGLLCAYALARLPFPAAVTFPPALLVAVLSTGLGWLRLAGRPALEWAVFGARFVTRAREGSLLIAPGPAVLAAGNVEAPRIEVEPVRTGPPGAGVVVPLFGGQLGRPHPAAHRIVFFSLKGGVGRTTLSVEVACWLGAVGARRVALVDLDVRSPSVAVRLGIPRPMRDGEGVSGPAAPEVRVMHRTGVQVIQPGAASPSAAGLDAAIVTRVLERLDQDRFHVVVMDVGADPCGLAGVALRQADDVFVVVTPTSTGLHDAYRTTEALRRAGLRDRLSCVVNRARRNVDISETLGDLGLPVVAEIPEDAALVEAENSHRLVAIESGGASAMAIVSVGEYVLQRLDR